MIVPIYLQAMAASFDPSKLAALIPTLMGVAGSVNILRLVKRTNFGNSCKRVLFGMSICEVVSSIAFSLQSLFIPRNTSHFLWAIGNGSALGLMMSFSIYSFLYNCILSFVYLAKVQAGSNKDFTDKDFVQKRIEPWTGAMGFSYPILTAMIGAGMRVYSEMDFAASDATLQKELSAKIGHFLFPGYPLTFLLAAIVLNSLVIFAFVRAGKKFSRNNESPTLASQTQVNAVATASVLLTYAWTAILRVFESNDIRSNNEAGLFPLLLLQAFFLPALALFNVVTWLQPRFRRVREIYPFESNVWCVERAVFGEKITPTKGWQPEIGADNQEQDFNFSARRRVRF